MRSPIRGLLLTWLALVASDACSRALALHANPASSGPEPGAGALAAQVGGTVRLPCLVGRQLNCGPPYLIAWYKFNASRAAWTRLEYSRPDDKDEQQGADSAKSRFKFYRGLAASSCGLAASSSRGPDSGDELECSQLAIERLDLADEAQYKCEITFSESLDTQKCPPSSVTRLIVIGEFCTKQHSTRSNKSIDTN